MLNKMKLFRDKFSEKTKLIIYISTAAVVFIFCALIPLAFRGDMIVDSIFDTGARAAMFAQYMEKSDEVRVKVDSKPDKAEIKYCDNLFDELYDRCILDAKNGKMVTEGQEFIVLSDMENSMRMCHMWVQDQGDWTNWMDIYMDVDTGFVYYLYVSSICLNNAVLYYDAVGPDMGAKLVADRISAETGFGLEILSWSGKAEDTATAYTYSNGESLIWNINCSYYPSSMLDLKISVA